MMMLLQEQLNMKAAEERESRRKHSGESFKLLQTLIPPTLTEADEQELEKLNVEMQGGSA
jgi:hypothetical protein